MQRIIIPALLSLLFTSSVFAKVIPYSAPDKGTPSRNSPIVNNVANDKLKPKNDYNITINYELGMHCTGFDFSYCCILPPYNSIQSQVVKTADGPFTFPQLLKADPKDPTVLLDGKKRDETGIWSC